MADSYLTETGDVLVLEDLTDFWEYFFAAPTSTVTWWNGTTEQPAVLEGRWNGTSVDPVTF